ncbi:copper transporter [Caminicella sporogenes]|uniref:copper transporter n=1 Tax=Caminicella sporogenes TaxID=166485 RepID=UPI0025418AC2|nr:copper transporter [Caminicella sporogenes]WIF94553.1 copper transporter [Caminicella sporogenes]
MVINMKYFVTTIISIFLSLSIGIFIGALLDSQQLFIQQQRELVAQIEEDFDIYKRENSKLMDKIEKLEVENNRYKQFLKKIENLMIMNNKKDFNIIFIKFYDEDERKHLETFNLLKKMGIKNIYEISINKMNKNSLSDKIIEYLRDDSKLEFDYRYGFKEKLDYIVIIDGVFKENLKNIKNIKFEIDKEIGDLNIPFVFFEHSTSDFLNIYFYTKNRELSIDNLDSKYMELILIMILDLAKNRENEMVEKFSNN